MKSASTITTATYVGKGREDTSPAKYLAVVAAETIVMDAKSSNKVAPTRAKDLADTCRPKTSSDLVIKQEKACGYTCSYKEHH